MELREKKTISDIRILTSSKFLNDNNEYICGYFFFPEEIKTNKDFILCYLFCNWWQLDITQMMIDYSKNENYSQESFTKILKLLPESQELYDMIDSIENSKDEIAEQLNKEICDKIIEDEDFNDCWLALLDLKLKNPTNYIQYLLDNEIYFNDITFDENNAIYGLKLIKAMLKLDYQPGESMVDFFIKNRMGTIAKYCAPQCQTDCILELYPTDLDWLYVFGDKDIEYVLEYITENNTVDAALLIEIVERLNITNKRQMISLITLILNKNDFITLKLFLEYILSEGFSIGEIYNNLCMINKSEFSILVYQIVVINNTNYDFIKQKIDDIEREKHHYVGSCPDLTEMKISTFSDDSNSSNSSNSSDSSDDEDDY